MATAGVGGANALYVTKEAVYGTYQDPSGATGSWSPFLSETIDYTEAKYYSQQIRQQLIDSDVKPGPYHVAGSIVMEVDCNYLPYFLYASRHTVVKTGAAPPYLYTATPATFGSSYPAGVNPGVSLTMIRNAVGFGYSGCVVTQWVWAINNGVLEVTMDILGLAEQVPVALGTPTFIAPSIYGEDAHTIFTDASGVAPAFGAGGDNTFNGFSATFNYNGAPQNRIRPQRSASFISYGKTDYSYATQLDFLDRTEYNNMVNSTTKAIQFQSITPGGATGTWAAATEGVRITMRRSNYDTYVVNTPAIQDLVMAAVSGHGLAQTGAAAYTIEVKSNLSI